MAEVILHMRVDESTKRKLKVFAAEIGGSYDTALNKLLNEHMILEMARNRQIDPLEMQEKLNVAWGEVSK